MAVAIAAALSLLVLAVFAPLASPSTPPTGCAKSYSRADFHRTARTVFRSSPYTTHERVTLRRVVRCQAYAKSVPIVRHHLARYKRSYRVRLLLPFVARDGSRWAIPVVVIGCEGGVGGWGTENHEGSGAIGPYQLLGHGAPWPANTAAKRMAHHRIARRLYLTQGLGPWVSSRHCWG